MNNTRKAPSKNFFKLLVGITLISILILASILIVVGKRVDEIPKGKESEHLKLLWFGESINSLKAVQKLAVYYGKKEEKNIEIKKVITKYFLYSCENKYDEKAKEEASKMMMDINPQVINISCNMKEEANYGEHYKMEELISPNITIEIPEKQSK
jgi:hypothetical protein